MCIRDRVAPLGSVSVTLGRGLRRAGVAMDAQDCRHWLRRRLPGKATRHLLRPPFHEQPWEATSVQAGELGFIHTIRAATHDQSPPHAAYIPTSGGLFRDCSVHDFDILRFVTGQELSLIHI